MFFQHRDPSRVNVGSRVEKEVRRKVEGLSYRFNCSMSFVVNTLLARQLDVKLDEEFYDIKKRSTEARSAVTPRGKRKGKRTAA